MTQDIEKTNAAESPSETVDLSVLISCYFEEQTIDEFYRRLSTTLEGLGRSYEIIFVNDGSTDGTFAKLKAIFERDEKVSAVVDFFKNAGQANAKTPAVRLARGRAFVLIDSDLQLDPEELPSLLEKYDEGYDIVTGYRKKRKDPLFRKLTSKIANMIMRKASGRSLRDFGCTFKIYDGRLVRAFEFGPFKPWRLVPVLSMAQRIAEIPITHHPRPYGKSGWTLRKLFAYNMEHVMLLSQRPFQILAGACGLFAAIFGLRIAFGWVLPFSILPRVTTGLLLNFMVFSLLVTTTILAAVGEFVIRNFVVLQRTPAYAIREILKR